MCYAGKTQKKSHIKIRKILFGYVNDGRVQTIIQIKIIKTSFGYVKDGKSVSNQLLLIKLGGRYRQNRKDSLRKTKNVMGECTK